MKKNYFSFFATTVLLFCITASMFAQYSTVITNNRKERVNITGTEKENLLSSVNVTESTKPSITLNSDNNRALISVVPTNNSSSNNARAPQGSKLFNNCRYVITADEMTSSGFVGAVTSVGWRWNNPLGAGAPTSQGVATTGKLRVYLKDTAVAPGTVTLTTTYVDTNGAGYTKVIDGTISIPSGTQEINIDVPVGGPGTSTFTHAPGMGVMVIYVYKTTSTPLGAANTPTVSCTNVQNGTTIVNGISTYQSTTTPGAIGGLSSFRPETRFGNTLIDAIKMGPIYSLGKAALCPCPDTNLMIVNMFHLNTNTDTVIVTTTVKNAIGGGVKHEFIDTIISNAIERWVIYYLYQKDGDIKKLDSIITVGRITGAEDVTGNNRDTYTKLSTLNTWNQATPNGVVSGGVGFTGGSGDFVAGFYTSCTIPLCALDLSFFAATGGGSQPYIVKVFAMDNDTLKPGPLLYQSGTQTSPPGITGTPQKLRYKFPSPVMVGPGYFFVGLAQTGTTNLSFSYQDENPIRFSTFFYASPPGAGNWTDFAAAGANFRLDIAPVTHLNLQFSAWLEGFYNGTAMVPDTVKAIARSLTTLQPIDTAKAVLNSSGTAIFNFCLLNNDSCYIYQLRQRNHIQTWSHQSCEQINICGKIYNFQNNITSAYGSNMVFIPGLENSGTGGYGFFTGDVNQDDVVDGSDCGDIDNDASNFVTGYVNTDLNGDEIVDGLDGAYCDNNSANFVSAVFPSP